MNPIALIEAKAAARRAVRGALARDPVSAGRSPLLVLNGTGKTGRRVVERLEARGVGTRVGSRSGEPAFDCACSTARGPARW